MSNRYMKGGKPLVVIEPYNPHWPARFRAEASKMGTILTDQALAIEHIGSTSVPGLCAKPIVDIAVGVESLSPLSSYSEPLARLGYSYVPDAERDVPNRRYFHKGPIPLRTFHLHVLEFGEALWRRHMNFRASLRTNEELRSAYAQLKWRLAEEFREDRHGYTAAKAAFIDAAVTRYAPWVEPISKCS